MVRSYYFECPIAVDSYFFTAFPELYKLDNIAVTLPASAESCDDASAVSQHQNHLSYSDRLCLQSLERRRLSHDHILVYKIFHGLAHCTQFNSLQMSAIH